MVLTGFRGGSLSLFSLFRTFKSSRRKISDLAVLVSYFSTILLLGLFSTCLSISSTSLLTLLSAKLTLNTSPCSFFYPYVLWFVHQSSKVIWKHFINCLQFIYVSKKYIYKPITQYSLLFEGSIVLDLLYSLMNYELSLRLLIISQH